jgi:5-methylcytosine-specific restriction enzyme B
MLWALLLFRSNTKARTKRQQIRDVWGLSGQHLAENHPLLGDKILVSMGPGFNNYRPNELELKIEAGAQEKTFADYFGSPAAFVP